MKKVTLSSCLTRIIWAIILFIGFIWVLSLLFPRAYNNIEGKILGIEESTVIDTSTVIVDTISKIDAVTKDTTLSIKLEHEGNCYLIPTTVNGIPMKMTLDTGASNLVISVVEYMFLKKQNLLNDTTMQEAQCEIANGKTENCYSIKLAEIEIGGKKVKDVDCIVMESQDASILLGMNVLEKLGTVSIDYKNNILTLK